MMKGRRVLVVGIIAVVVLLIIYVVISLLNAKTIKAEHVNVVGYQETADSTEITVGIGVSNRVLAYSKYRTEGKKLYITVKEGPLWGVYPNRWATMKIKVPLKNANGEKYQYYFEDKEHTREIVKE